MIAKHLLYLSVAALPFSAFGELAVSSEKTEPEFKSESKQLSAFYLDRVDALPYVMQTLMDQHSRRVKERRLTEDGVYLGALQSVLASLEDAKKAFIEGSQKDAALTKSQRTLVTKLKAVPQTKLMQKKRASLAEDEIIALIVREKAEISPIIREFHTEASSSTAER